MSEQNTNDNLSNVKNISVKNFVHENGLPYAYYVIRERAITDQDGLKPVARRIIYSAYINGAKKGKFMKAGTLASVTMGNFHPHGNLSIEAALARLAQNFSMRVPLFDVQGSVGFVTGDQPAAARYYEVSLSEAGLELVKDIDNNTVEMTRNFSDTMDEPVVLPVRFPNTIINGTSGIAVGYASNICAHNPDEVMDACIHYLKNEINNVDDLMKYIKGPDFPTGGKLMGLDGVRDYLETGNGSFIIRGKYEIKVLSRGRTEITFYELPYQVSAEQVITAISKAQDKNKLRDISEVKDLSGMNVGLKLSIYVKAGANAKMVLEDLWKLTPCEQSTSVNATVLIDSKPVQASMLTLIEQFLQLKEECFVRSKEFKLEKLEKEDERLSAILAVLIDIDKAVSIIRKSKDYDEASKKLQKSFKINETQAAYILQLQLRTLTKSDKDKISIALEENEKEKAKIKEILNSDDLLKTEIIKELEETKKIISDPRRTEISNITNEDLAQKQTEMKKAEKILSKNVKCEIIQMSDHSIVKTIDEYKNSDTMPIYKSFNVQSLDNIFIISKKANIIEYNVANIPLNTKSKIELLGINNNDFSSIVTSNKNIIGVLTITNKGGINITKMPIRADYPLIQLDNDEYIVYSSEITQEDFDTKKVLMLSYDGNLAKFDLSTVRFAGQGSKLISGMKSDNVVGAIISNDEGQIITYSIMSIKTTNISDIPTTSRSVKGSMLHKPYKDEILTGMCLNDNIVLNDIEKKIKLPELSDRAKRGEKVSTYSVKYVGH